MKLGKQTMHERIRNHIRKAIPAAHEPRWKHVVAWIVLIGLGLTLAGFFILTILIATLSLGLPDVRDFDQLAGAESTLILDRDGGILYTIYGEQNRKYVALDEISPHLQNATVAIEDDQFYEHAGFDIPAIARGIIYEVSGLGGRRRGGSTITQQLSKNAFLTSEKSYIRKIKELIISVRVERAYDKDKILELYLNRIPYGNNAYGAELAAKMYFDKSAKDITLAESAILASLPNAPTHYSPYGSYIHSTLDREIDIKKEKIPESVLDLDPDDYTTGLLGREVVFSDTQKLFIPGRADIVLSRMEDLGYITPDEHKEASKQLQTIEFTKSRVAIRAAHFVFYIRSQLEEQFGKEVVERGGLRVYTTIDPKLQDSAEKFVEDQIKISKTSHGATTGALFSVDATTGQIIAMVGSHDYFDIEAHGSVNHVFAKRQPGSSFKPIIYAKAFLNRYAPATVLYDTPTNFGSYSPQNYEGGFRGPMTIRSALGQSRNIPAIKAYFLAGQQEEIVPFAQSLGINSLNPKGDYGPPLALGAGEVTLAEMVQAFSVFATNGVKREPYAILKVVDRNSKTLFEKDLNENPGQQVLDPQVAYLINDVLSDKSVYLGPRLDVAGHKTAVKTGTSNKEITPVKILPSNLWTVGYTPSVVTGVWVGNSDGSPMNANADGYNVAAPIWSKFMAEALKGKPNEEFARPEGIKSVTVSSASGRLPGKDQPPSTVRTDVFASFSVPTEYDDIYKQVEVVTVDNMLPNEFTPSELIEKRVFMNHHDPINTFASWQAGINSWVAGAVAKDPNYPGFPPTEKTTRFTAETEANKPTIQFVTPAAFATVTGNKVEITVSVNAPNEVSRILFYLDDRTVPNTSEIKPPYNTTIRLPANSTGIHTVTARITDKLGYMGEAKVEFRVEQKEEEPLIIDPLLVPVPN